MIDLERNGMSVKLLRSSLLFLMRVLFRIEHHGVENIPSEGPLIVVPNHVTYFDPFWIAVRMRRNVRFMAWDKIFSFPVAGTLFRWLGAFPVNLDKPESSAFKTALRYLQMGQAVMIFPEGGRSPDGQLMQFKDGAARLASRTGASLLPVYIEGSHRVWSSSMRLPQPRKVRVHFLEPLPNELLDRNPGEIMQQIRNIIEAQRRPLPGESGGPS